MNETQSEAERSAGRHEADGQRGPVPAWIWRDLASEVRAEADQAWIDRQVRGGS
jgi:hypothetical protein